MSHVLIADDDKDLVEGLRWYLEDEGFEVTTAYNGIEAVSAMREQSPDVAILDIMMPEMDGVEVCKLIRNESDIYIMILSARDGEIDKVRALEMGADDYLTKPFHATELVARIKALLRRQRGSTQSAPSYYQWQSLKVFLDDYRVTVDGEPVELTPSEFCLLKTLMGRPQTVMSREQLVEAVWGDDFFGELRLVDNHIYHLREKLTAAGLEDCPIYTVRRAGYVYRP